MAEIGGGLVDAENPLEFVKQNLARLQAQQNPQPAAPAPTPEAEVAKVVATTESKRAEEKKVEDDHAKIIEDELAAEGAKKAAEEQEKAPEVPETDEVAEGETPEDSKEINFRNLRKSLNEYKQQVAQKEKELEEFKTKVEKYETGEELPEPLREKADRIQELEYYEKLHALKKSPHYRERFIEPMNDLKTKLLEYAKDYEIPADVMNQALSLKSRAQLNQFLSDHFDEVGALEVKTMITKLQDMHQTAERAELEPLEAMERLEQESKLLQEQERQRNRVVIGETAKTAWVESLVKIKEEGKALELIPSETDTDRTDKFVKPLLNNASKDYAKIVKMLAENGLTKLPKDLAFALARACQLAVASAVSIDRANATQQHAEEVEKNTERTTRYLRPQIGSMIGSGGAGEAPKTTTPAEAADALLRGVLGRR